MFNIIPKILNFFTKKTNSTAPAIIEQNHPKTDKPATARVVPTAPIKDSIKAYHETVKLTPQTNGQYAQKIKPSAIVLHDTGGNYLGSIDWTSKVFYPNTTKRLYASYHCIVSRDGRRTITNLDNNRAYHAGASSFKGKSGLNQWSIGVSFERDSHTEPLQKAAMESALEYIIPRMKKWGIAPDMVTDHRTVSPGRKVDLKKEEFEKFHALLKKRYNE
jgi:N-acetyl-anhydromuramyl-L-alanine amidase AmpD